MLFRGNLLSFKHSVHLERSLYGEANNNHG
jgi:hypothetical protein